MTNAPVDRCDRRLSKYPWTSLIVPFTSSDKLPPTHSRYVPVLHTLLSLARNTFHVPQTLLAAENLLLLHTLPTSAAENI